jgi:hypothetical protein
LEERHTTCAISAKTRAIFGKFRNEDEAKEYYTKKP